MRRILVDNARRKQAEKHGGERQRVDLDSRPNSIAAADPDDLLALDEALTRLASDDPEAAELVKLRSSPACPSRKPPRLSAVPRPPPTGTGPMPAPGCTAELLRRRRGHPESPNSRETFLAPLSHCTYETHAESDRHERRPANRQKRSSSQAVESARPGAVAGVSGRSLCASDAELRQPRRSTARRLTREAASVAATHPASRRARCRRCDARRRAPRHGHRPVQADRADRRRRHGHGLDGPADRAGQAPGGASSSSRPAWTRSKSSPASRPSARPWR